MDNFAQSFGSFLESSNQHGEPGSPAAPPTDFASSFNDFLDDRKRLNEAAASLSLMNANRANPDQAARAQALAGQIGLPPDTVERNLPDVEAQVKLAGQQQALKSSPFLASWVQDVGNAKVAHDDFERLSWLEQKVTAFKRGVAEAGAGAERGDLYRYIRDGDATPEQAARYAEIKAQPQHPAPDGIGNMLAGMAGGVAGMLVEAYGSDSAIQAGVAGGVLGSVVGPEGTAAGALVGWQAGAITHAVESGYGAALERYDQLVDSTGQGLDEWAKQGLAVVAGIINGVMTRVGGGAAAEAGRLATERLAVEAAARPQMAQAAAEFAKGMASGAWHAGKVGAGLTAADVAAEQMARGINNIVSGTDFTTWSANPDTFTADMNRVAEEGLKWALFGATMHTLPGTAGLIAEGANSLRARRDAQFMTDLAQGSVDSRLRQRAPDSFQAFIAHQTDGSAVENLYIPAERVRELYQSMGIDPAQGDPIFGFVPDMPKQLEIALENGGDVRVPTAGYAARLAGSKVDQALRPDLRVGEGGVTLRELSEFQARANEIYAQRAEEWRRQVESETEARSPAEAVYNDWLTQLRAADVAPAEAHAVATLTAAHYEAWAEQYQRAGDDRHDAWTLYQQAQSRVVPHLPERLRRYDVDALIASRAGDGPNGPDLLSRPATSLDGLIDELRGGQRQAAQNAGPTLAQFISRRGGVADPGGELAAMGADRWHVGRRFTRKLVRKDAGPEGEYHPDAVARAAWEAGFFPELQGERPSPDHLVEALRDELRGNARHADLSGKLDDDGHLQARAELERALDDLGIDLHSGAGRDNRYVKEALARQSRAADGSRELAQASSPLKRFRIGRAAEMFAKSVQNLLRGTAAFGTYRLGDTPPVLLALGLDNADVTLSKSVIEKAIAARKDTSKTAGKHNVRVTPDNVLDLVQAIADPIAIFEDGPQHGPGRMVVITDMVGRNGDPIAVVVAPHGALGGKPANFVPTIHERTEPMGALRYVRSAEDIPRLPHSWTKSPGGTGSLGASAVPSVLTKDDVVNRYGSVFWQSGSDKRGSIQLPAGGYGSGPHVINLFAARNRSTLFHETAHLWLEELIHHASSADAPAIFHADMAAVNHWLGVDHSAKIGDAEHERFARGFEAYLMEGKAPAPALEAVFAKVRSWLVNLYTRLVKRGESGATARSSEPGSPLAGLEREAGFAVTLTPEIRAVMDRLLATDEQIALARDGQGLRQLFRSPEEAGMAPAEFDAYTKAVEQAKAEAVAKVEAKAMAELRRETEKWWKAEAAALRETVAAEIDARPDIQALHYFKTGKLLDGRETEGGTRVRLSERSVVDMFGAGILRELPNAVPKLTTRDGGFHPDVVAEMFGMRSGEDLVKALLQLKQQEDQLRSQGDTRSLRQHLIETMTHDRMVERHGDILRDGTIADEALAAIHNDRQAEVLAAELRALNRRPATITHQGRRWAVGPVTPLEHARQIARRQVAEMQVRHLNLNALARAEAKSGREAERALVAGDRAAAVKAKEQQLLNHTLFIEAKKAKDEIDRAVAMMGKLAAKDTIKGLDQGYLDQIHGLLERFDFRPASASKVAARESLASWIAEQEAHGAEVAIADRLRNEALRLHYSRLSVDEIRDLADAVRNIRQLGRLKQELLDNQVRREFDAWKAEALGALDALPVRDAPRELVIGTRPGLKGQIERAGMALRKGVFELLKAETIIDWLDNFDANGPFNRVLFKPMKEALFKEYERSKQIVESWKALEAQMPKDWARSLDSWIELPMRNADGETFRGEKRHVLGLALNWGNESNRMKLLEGYGGEKNGWTADTIQRVLDQHMTEADWKFVQGIWDTFDGLYPEIAALTKRLSGVEPEKIEARPVQTQWGAMKGGYFPVIYDPRRSERARQNLDKAALYDRATYVRATTPKGHTKARSEGYAAPIDFRSLELLPHRLSQHIHDLYFREAVNQANKVLADRGIRDAIASRLGKEAVEQLDGWVRSIANERNIDPLNYSFLERFLRRARANTVAVGIAFRLGTILKHDLSALSMSIEAVGAKAFMGATADLFHAGLGRHNALVKEIMEKSGEIRNRMNQYDRDTAHGLEKLAQYAGTGSARGIGRGVVKFADAFNHLGHLPVSYLDFLSTLPVWLATYRKGLVDGLGEDAAVYAADKMVRKAHGAQTTLDQAAVQRGSGGAGELKKMLTMFYGFFNRTFNGGADAVMRARRGMREAQAGNADLARGDFLKVASYAVGSMMVPAIIEAIVAGHTPQEDDNWLAWGAKAVMGQAFATVPLVRDLAGYFKTGRDYEFSPVVASINNVLRFVRHDVMGMFDDDDAMTHGQLKRALTAGGLVTGIGTGQLATSAQYFWDVLDGAQSPDDAMDFLRGIAFGPKKEH